MIELVHFAGVVVVISWVGVGKRSWLGELVAPVTVQVGVCVRRGLCVGGEIGWEV